jgi:hypothetical protein
LRNPPQFPVIIGVTGHRQIAPEAMQPVRAAVRRLLVQWRCHFGPALHVLTALADGADQLVADEARDANVPLIAVAPFCYDAYRETITNRDKLREHWNRAVLRLTLPRVGSGEDHERQYEQLGVLLIRRSHLLLGLWDGQMDEARGGTRDVMRMRLEGDHGATVFDESPMFLGAGSYLGETNRGPLLHVLTPRVLLTTDPPGTCRLLGLPTRQGFWDGIAVQPDRALDGIAAAQVTDFARIDSLNRAIGRLQGSDDLLFDVQLGYLETMGIPAGAQAQVGFLKQLQAAVDVVSQTYQVQTQGDFARAGSIRQVIMRALMIWRLTRRVPGLGAIFLVTAAVPLSALFFEFYAHLEGGFPALLAYLVVSGGAVTYRNLRSADQRFRDYRAMAEGLRVQLFWALSAFPAAVPDYYLNNQVAEIGWIRFALRGPALWAAALANNLATPYRGTVTDGWIEDQATYFAASEEIHSRAAKRGMMWNQLFLYGGFATAFVLLVFEFLHRYPHILGAFTNKIFRLVDVHHDGIVVLAALLPAVAAYYAESLDLRAHERLAHSYALMRRVFRRAAEIMNTPSLSDANFQGVVREIGREALAENAEWLVEHRHRKFEPR